MSVGALVGEIGGAVGTVVIVATYVGSVVRAARKQREEDADKLARKHDDGVAKGRADRDDEVRQLTYERDDARQRADRAEARADRLLEAELLRRKNGRSGA